MKLLYSILTVLVAVVGSVLFPVTAGTGIGGYMYAIAVALIDLALWTGRKAEESRE